MCAVLLGLSKRLVNYSVGGLLVAVDIDQAKVVFGHCRIVTGVLVAVEQHRADPVVGFVEAKSLLEDLGLQSLCDVPRALVEGLLHQCLRQVPVHWLGHQTR